MAINVPIITTFDSKGITKAIRDFKRLDTAGAKAGYGLQTIDAGVQKFVTSFAKIATVGSIAVGVIGKHLVDAAMESQKAMKQTEAIILATGGAANVTSAEVAKLSDQLSKQTGVDDELVQKSANLILTFKQVQNQVGNGNAIFDRAVQASLDLGNVFGSTDAAAKQLGKALSDPVRGVTALRKAGVNFSDSQRKQIKQFVETGKILDAQKLILKEVESQVGGTAAATSTDFDRMKVAVENVGESLGTLLLPAFEATARFVTEKLVPIFETFADVVGEKGIGAGFKYLGEQGLEALGKMDGWANLVYGVVAAVVALNVATGIYTAAQTLATIAMAAFGTAATGTAVAMNAAFFGIPALVGAVVVIIAALALKFAGFRNFLGTIPEYAKTAFNGLANIVEFQINNIIRSINLLIRAYNLIPFLKDVNTLDHVSLGFDKVAKSVGKVASAADFRKFEGFNPGAVAKTYKKPPAGGGGGGGADTTAIDKAKKALDKYTASLKLFATETKNYTNAVKGVATANDNLKTATDNVRIAQEKFNKVSKGYGADSKEAKTATKDLAQARRDATRATIGLRDATQGVADAQKKLDDLKSGKTTANAKEDLALATQEVEDAQKNLQAAYIQGGEKTIADAADRLNDAYDKRKDAIDAVRKAEEESNPAAIAEAEDDLTLAKIDLAEAEQSVADTTQDVIDKQKELNEIISGAPADSDAYKDALKDLTDAQKAEKDAIDAVTEAYERQTQAIIDLNNAKKGLTDASKGTTKKQEEEAQKITGIDPNTGLIKVPVKSGNNSDYNLLNGGLPNIDFSNIDFSGIDFSGIDLSGIPFLADGGIVNKPTLAMIGENGSEAIIPLSQMGNMGGGNINITVQTGVGDPVAIGKSVVDALQAYQRRSGALQIKVA